jgi:diguanylate cyclase (GGDEF)-like protein
LSSSQKIPEALPILLVDDDSELLNLLSAEIKKFATVESYLKPDAALEAVRRTDFAAIVSDLNMPGMNGIEFLASCAELKPSAQRILLTGHADLANLFETVNKAKLNALIAKPWEPDALKSILQNAIRQNEILRENEELRRIALTDALTSIYNHRYFWERLESEFSRAKRYGRPLSLIMCDIDDFKKYNDTYGHPRGDAILKDVAQCLEKNRRSMDSVARYGGEEFGIILPEVTHSQALEISRRHLQTTQKTTGISLSFGVATFPEQAQSSTELVHTADQALLRAKAEGKAQVVSAERLKPSSKSAKKAK